jgi:toxin FitB
MKYVLDTNAVCEPSRPSPNPHLEAWLGEHWNDCAISAVTLAEMRYGVQRLPGGKRRARLERELDFLEADLEGRILPFDQAEASEWGRYAARLEAHFGAGALSQFDIRDTLIAATALEYGLLVVTNNEKDFPLVPTINPFKPQAAE